MFVYDGRCADTLLITCPSNAPPTLHYKLTLHLSHLTLHFNFSLSSTTSHPSLQPLAWCVWKPYLRTLPGQVLGRHTTNIMFLNFEENNVSRVSASSLGCCSITTSHPPVQPLALHFSHLTLHITSHFPLQPHTLHYNLSHSIATHARSSNSEACANGCQR